MDIFHTIQEKILVYNFLLLAKLPKGGIQMAETTNSDPNCFFYGPGCYPYYPGPYYPFYGSPYFGYPYGSPYWPGFYGPLGESRESDEIQDTQQFGYGFGYGFSGFFWIIFIIILLIILCPLFLRCLCPTPYPYY